MGLNIIVKKGDDNPNKIYREAKEYKEKFKDKMLSKNELWKPTEENVRKQIHFEQQHGNDVRAYRERMAKLDKDPDALNVQKLRRGY